MDVTQLIDWTSSESYLRLNPQLPERDLLHSQKLFEQAPDLAGHIWVSTSGSTRAENQSPKLVALSKRAFLSSAQAVNQHLQSDSSDVWLLALPTFHVGGLSILARSHLSGARVVEWTSSWDPQACCEVMERMGVTLTALVPTQIFDLVKAELSAPASLRAVVIGGGALSATLYHEARTLGWPVLPSFGMTECCSQIATAPLESLLEESYPDLQLLSHLKTHTDDTGRLGISGAALLSLYAQSTDNLPQFWDPKQEGILWTEDHAHVQSGYLKPLGRSQDFVKISGENVNLSELNRIFAEVSPDFASSSLLIALADERAGARVVWVTELSLTAEQQREACQRFAEKILPVARIRAVYRMPALPRSPLGKILREPVQCFARDQAPQQVI